MELQRLVDTMRRDGSFESTANAVAVQFGTRNRQYLGARLMPERRVSDNRFTAKTVLVRSPIANASTRHSPVQRKRGMVAGSYDVQLAEFDRGAEFTAEDHDAVCELLRRPVTLDDAANLLDFMTTQVVIPLVEAEERSRWECLTERVVKLRGDNGLAEDVPYPNPAGHVRNVAVPFGDPTADALAEFAAILELMASNGVAAREVFAGTPAINRFLGNAAVKSAVSGLIVVQGGALTVQQTQTNLAAVNDYLSRQGWPTITRYDLQYHTQTGSGFFLRRDAMVFTGATDEALDVADGDEVETLPNLLGYLAVGRASGQSASGRAVRQRVVTDEKPPFMDFQGWETVLPILTQPNAVVSLIGA